MADHDPNWTEDQRALYDEAFGIGLEWGRDPQTDAGDLQQVINLAEIDEDELAGIEITHPPLVDAVVRSTGQPAETVRASRSDPAFSGFVDGVRDGVADDTFGL